MYLKDIIRGVLKLERNEYEELKREIEELKKEKDYWIKEIRDLETFYIRKYPGPYLEFEVHLSEHCNLNCKGCDHFSPLAEKGFADIDIFKKDFYRMSELFGECVKSINLLGGEPLLNENICEFLVVARNSFPFSTTEIRLVTNGLLLESMKSNFWETCKKQNIHIYITKYPINLDYNKLFDLANRQNVYIGFYDPVEGDKELYRVPLKLEGDMDPKRSYYKCPCANVCCFLKEGRLYTCTLVPNIEHFMKFFGVNFEISDEDSIDIYKATDKNEIFEFLSKPIPFCRYCDTESKAYGIKWTISEKKIDEWMV